MDEGVSVLVCQLVGMGQGLIEHVSFQHYFSAVASGAVDLHQRCGGRHDNRGLNAGQLGRIGDSLGVVSGGGSNQSFLLFLL